MKAIVQGAYGPPEALRLAEVDKPTVGDNNVLVRVQAAGVDPSVWHLVTGLPLVARLMGVGFRRPKSAVPGSDVAGLVEAVGRNVTQFRPGDEVFGTCRGSFAEYARAREATLAPKPSSLSFEQAAAVAISATTALQGLRDVGKLQPGQKVLVTGAAGGVGSYAVQVAKALGAEVTGVCSTAKVDLVRSLGVGEVIDYTREDFTAGRRKYDLILDTAGSRPLLRLRRALTPQGALVIVGGEGGGRLLGPLGRLVRAGVLAPFVRQRLGGFMAAIRKKDLQFLSELIEAGKITPVIDRTYPLAQAAEALRYSMQGHARGKVVIIV